jgi:hypothetical protein
VELKRDFMTSSPNLFEDLSRELSLADTAESSFPPANARNLPA